MILKLSKPLYRIGIIRKAGIIICLDNRIFIMLKKFYWAPKLFSLMFLGLFILSMSSFLAGCGNKGDLFLPEQGSLNGDSAKQNTIQKNTVLK